MSSTPQPNTLMPPAEPGPFLSKSLMLLVLCQGLFLTNNVSFIAINGLVGLSLSPTPWMATLPVMGYVVGSAMSTALVAQVQSRWGRRRSFQLGLLVGLLACLLCAAAVYAHNFWGLIAGTVVAGFSSGELTAYRYENGRPVWQDSLSRTSITTSVASLVDIDASPVVDQGRVYAIGKGGRMVAMDILTGQRLWELNIAGTDTPWIAGEWLFAVTDDAKLLCIARNSGKIRWLTQLPAYKNNKKSKNPISWSGPILAGGRLILTSTQGDVLNVAVEDGKIGTRSKLGTKIYQPPIVADGTLLVLTDSGRLQAYR